MASRQIAPPRAHSNVVQLFPTSAPGAEVPRKTAGSFLTAKARETGRKVSITGMCDVIAIAHAIDDLVAMAGSTEHALYLRGVAMRCVEGLADGGAYA